MKKVILFSRVVQEKTCKADQDKYGDENEGSNLFSALYDHVQELSSVAKVSERLCEACPRK